MSMGNPGNPGRDGHESPAIQPSHVCWQSMCRNLHIFHLKLIENSFVKQQTTSNIKNQTPKSFQKYLETFPKSALQKIRRPSSMPRPYAVWQRARLAGQGGVSWALRCHRIRRRWANWGASWCWGMAGVDFSGFKLVFFVFFYMLNIVKSSIL